MIDNQWLQHQMELIGIHGQWSQLLVVTIGLLLALTVARLGFSMGNGALNRILKPTLLRLPVPGVRIPQETRLVNYLAHFVPLGLLSWLLPAIVDGYPLLQQLTTNLLGLYTLLIIGLVFNTLISLAGAWLAVRPYAHRVPHQGLIQLARVSLLAVLIIFALSLWLDRSPVLLLSGLGAISAVTLLVFKDTILGFVAGVQLSANDMLRRGDWVEMPQFGADGEVEAITLTTVKIRNWDKTISTVPAYALISGSFKNWRGMSESGGRRIKRSIHLDVNSVKTLNMQLRNQLQQLMPPATDQQVNSTEAQTNAGALRAYLEAYLRQHPAIHPRLTLIVRQLPAGATGLPIEIYCFSQDQRWAHYEALQADIVEHVYAILPKFQLRPFQQPTGYDLSLINDQA